MEPNQARKFLRETYPTTAIFEQAIKIHGTQKAISELLGISRTTVYYHKKWLADGKRPIAEKQKRHYMRNGELDKRIREMVGSGYTNVKVYKLKEDYIEGQVMDQGDFVREEVSQTAISYWGRVDL